MKKFKKMLAGLLGAAMVLTSFGTPTWADPNTPVKTDATIDINQEGSITIHKYEYNGDLTKDAAGEYDGTGEKVSDDKLPGQGDLDGADADAKPLAGAGFTIYKVKDAEGITEYYSKNPTELPKVDEFVAGNSIKDTYKDNIVYVDASGKAVTKNTEGAKTQIETTADGTASFTNLAVGFYVVIETKTPDKVTAPAAPFIVSVPMTKADGSGWLYDVHVYPKNKTTYGSVTLIKNGNKNTPLSGVTFKLEKQSGTDWNQVTESDKTDEHNNKIKLDLVTDKDGKITVDGLSQGKYRFTEINRGDNAGYIMDGVSTYEFTIDSKGSVTYNNITKPTATITVTNEKPDMTKEVKRRTATDEPDKWGQNADYNIGDKVPYRIKIDVPSNITKLKDFTLTDTPTNLTDDTNSIKMTYKANDTDEDTEIKATVSEGENTKQIWSAAKTTGSNTDGFVITFKPENMAAYAGKQIVITYEATLKEDALTTIEGNPNTASLEYSNSILPDSSTNPGGENPKPGKDKIEDNAVVYTFSLKIDKRANIPSGDKLSGVMFDLYKVVSDNGDDIAGTGLDSGRQWKKIASDLTTTDGEVTKSGLANGTYCLVETKTVQGYNLLKAPVEVKLDIQYATSMKETWDWESYTDSNGTAAKKLVKHTIESNKTIFTEKDVTSNGTHTETIINRKGFTLPKTGDIGTAMFLIIGIGGMLAAVYIMLRGRKRA